MITLKQDILTCMGIVDRPHPCPHKFLKDELPVAHHLSRLTQTSKNAKSSATQTKQPRFKNSITVDLAEETPSEAQPK